MAITRLQSLKSAKPGPPARDTANPRQALTEESCLTALSVLGAMLFLLLLVVMVRMLYFVLTMQNGMIILPVAGAS